jgi:hypothetical protein
VPVYGNTGRDPYRDLALADVSTDDEEPMQSFPFTEWERGTLLHGIAASLFLPLLGSGSLSPPERLAPAALDTMVCSAFGLQALQDIEPRQRPTCLLDQPAIAQIA